MSTTRPAHLRRPAPARRPSRPATKGRPRLPEERPRRAAAVRRTRAEAARAAGRRRLTVLAGVATLAALVGGSLAIAHSPLFSARDVRVLGATHGESREILAVSGLGAHPPLIDINPAAGARAVERLAWVATARVTVSFPSSATVSVTERVPVAFVPAGGGGALVDASGRVLADVGRRPAGVVSVKSGVSVPRPGKWFTKAARGLFTVAAEVPLSLVGRITDLTSTRRDGIVVGLANEPVVIFGSSANARAKFVALATVLADVSLNGIGAIDLRAPSNPVLTP